MQNSVLKTAKTFFVKIFCLSSKLETQLFFKITVKFLSFEVCLPFFSRRNSFVLLLQQFFNFNQNPQIFACFFCFSTFKTFLPLLKKNKTKQCIKKKRGEKSKRSKNQNESGVLIRALLFAVCGFFVVIEMRWVFEMSKRRRGKKNICWRLKDKRRKDSKGKKPKITTPKWVGIA